MSLKFRLPRRGFLLFAVSTFLTIAAQAPAAEVVGFPGPGRAHPAGPMSLRYVIHKEYQATRGEIDAIEQSVQKTFPVALDLAMRAKPLDVSYSHSVDVTRDCVIEITNSSHVRSSLETLAGRSAAKEILAYTSLREKGSGGKQFVVRILWDRAAMARLDNGMLVVKPNALAIVTTLLMRELYGTLPRLWRTGSRPFASEHFHEALIASHEGSTEALRRLVDLPFFSQLTEQEQFDFRRFLAYEIRQAREWNDVVKTLRRQMELDFSQTSERPRVKPFQLFDIRAIRCQALFNPTES